MKKIAFFAMGLISMTTFAQYEGRVGVNVNAPSAVMNIKSKDDVKSPKNLELENQGGTKLMTVLNNGNVGIGLDDPLAKFHIKAVGTPGTLSPGVGNDLFYDYYENGTTSVEDPITIYFRRFGGTESASSNIKNNTSVGEIFFYGLYNNATDEVGRIRSVYTGDGTTSSGQLQFGIKNNNDIVINKVDGDDINKIGIGKDNPTEKLDVAGNIKLSGVIKLQSQDVSGSCESGSIAYGTDGDFYACKDRTWNKIVITN